MRLSSLLAAFDDALEWPVDDALLADHLPSQLEEGDPWPEAASAGVAAP